MNSYKIFLTKSHEAVTILRDGLAAEKDNPKLCTGLGCADDADFIPATYKGCGYFYAAAWYESDAPTYKLVIC